MRKRFNKSFTLVELLIVLVIISVLLGFAVPAFSRLLRGNSVSIAARMLDSQLRLARAEAISKRCNVGIMMYGKDFNVASLDPDAQYGYSAFRAAYVDGNGNFQEWVPGTQWTTIPQGALILMVQHGTTTSPLLNASNEPAAWTPANAASITGNNDYVNTHYRYVAFTPKGYSVNGNVIISICEGVADSSDADYGYIRANYANCIVLKVDRYSGRVTYLYNGKL